VGWIRCDNEILEAVELAEDRVLLITRRHTDAVSPERLAAAFFEALGEPLPEHRDWTVVVDSRLAPPRNDARLEAQLQRVRARMLSQFGHMIVVVASAAGRLQARRLGRETIVGDVVEAMQLARARG